MESTKDEIIKNYAKRCWQCNLNTNGLVFHAYAT